MSELMVVLVMMAMLMFLFDREPLSKKHLDDHKDSDIVYKFSGSKCYIEKGLDGKEEILLRNDSDSKIMFFENGSYDINQIMKGCLNRICEHVGIEFKNYNYNYLYVAGYTSSAMFKRNIKEEEGSSDKNVFTNKTSCKKMIDHNAMIALGDENDGERLARHESDDCNSLLGYYRAYSVVAHCGLVDVNFRKAIHEGRVFTISGGEFVASKKPDEQRVVRLKLTNIGM
nr:hypothetical protein [uncultured Cohaesibacter sp.]